MKNISKEKLEKWKQSRFTKKLIYALKVGDFKTRLNAVKYLIELNDPKAKQALIKSLNENIPIVIEHIRIALYNLTLLDNEKQLVDLIINSKEEIEKQNYITELLILSKNIDDNKLKYKNKEEYPKSKAIQEKEIHNKSNRKILTIGVLITLTISFLAFAYFYEFTVKDGTSSVCSVCSGTAKIGDVCPNCNGTGKIVTTVLCNNCDGSGSVKCNYSFKLKTTYFLVAKRVSTYKCRNGRMYTDGIDKIYNGDICKECNGSGRETCYSCKGSGKVKKTVICKECDKGIVNIRGCDNCNKTGKVPNYEKFTIVNKYILPLFGNGKGEIN